MIPANLPSGPSTSNFPARMREERARIGMSQELLADILSEAGLPFHQATIYKIETGSRRVLLDEALTISQVLGIELDDRPMDDWKQRALAAEAKLRTIAEVLAS